MFFSRKTRLLSLSFSPPELANFTQSRFPAKGKCWLADWPGFFFQTSLRLMKGSDINLLLDLLFNSYIIVVDAEESFRGAN